MTPLENGLDVLLVKVYRSMEKLETTMLRASTSLNLSIGEIHALEAVQQAGKTGYATVSDIAEQLGVQLPTVTSTVKRLEQKGYVERQKCQTDGRVVRVNLTRDGRRAERAHRYFHHSMMRSLMEELSTEEETALIKGIEKLDKFLLANIEKYDNA